jgi:hypothetical protein
MKIETHICDSPIAIGTHNRGSGATSLIEPGADFKSCGIAIGMPIFNITQDTNGLITIVTENSITDDTNTWDEDDEYEIYVTTKNAFISSQVVDKRFGRRTDPKEMIDNLRPEDTDLDEDDENEDIFGPGQPERIR